MFNASDLTKAILIQFESHIDLEGVTIERNSRVNFYPSRMPWIGIYPGTVDTDPSTLGSRSGGRRWKETMHPKILLQAQNLDDEGASAADELEDLIEKCLLAIDSDLTFKKAGTRVIGMSREYSYVQMDEDEEGGLFFPQCEITLDVETKS